MHSSAFAQRKYDRCMTVSILECSCRQNSRCSFAWIGAIWAILGTSRYQDHCGSAFKTLAPYHGPAPTGGGAVAGESLPSPRGSGSAMGSHRSGSKDPVPEAGCYKPLAPPRLFLGNSSMVLFSPSKYTRICTCRSKKGPSPFGEIGLAGGYYLHPSC